jgi:hypothetical protein
MATLVQLLAEAKPGDTFDHAPSTGRKFRNVRVKEDGGVVMLREASYQYDFDLHLGEQTTLVTPESEFKCGPTLRMLQSDGWELRPGKQQGIVGMDNSGGGSGSTSE